MHPMTHADDDWTSPSVPARGESVADQVRIPEVVPAGVEPSRAIVSRQPSDALDAFTQTGGLERARKMANELGAVIKQCHLAVAIGDREHIRIEGWCTVGAMVGVTPRTVWARPAENTEVPGYTARVEVIRLADGAVVGAAEADCYVDELQHKRSGGYFFKWIVNSPEYEDAPYSLPDRYAFNRYAIKSMAQCVPLDAEILTRHGWRRPGDLAIGEEVLGYDLAEDQAAWTPLLDVSVFETGAKPLVRLRSRSFDVACTTDHTWAAVGSGYDERRRLVRTDALRSHGILVAAGRPAAGTCHAPRDAAVWGWLITDGCIRQDARDYWRAHVDQSKPEFIEKLKALLGEWITSEAWTTPDPENRTAAGRPWGTRPCVRFALSAAALRGLMERSGISDPSRDLLRYIASLDTDSRRSMLDAMIDADGHRRPGRKGRWRFAKIKQLTVDALHALCALEGLPLGRAHRVCKDSEIQAWALRKDRMVRARHLRREPMADEPTWCPTTGFGTWIMRWRGQVTITGNTRATSKALAQVLRWIPVLAGYSGTPAEEMSGLERAEGSGGKKGRDDPFERGAARKRHEREGSAPAAGATTTTPHTGHTYTRPPKPGKAPESARLSEGKGKMIWALAYKRGESIDVPAATIMADLCAALEVDAVTECHWQNFGDERTPERNPNWLKRFVETYPGPGPSAPSAKERQTSADFVNGDRKPAATVPAARTASPARTRTEPPDDDVPPPDDGDAPYGGDEGPF